MSSTTTPAGGATTTSVAASDTGASIPNTHSYVANLGLGYAIAIALGFLVLLSTLLLASYVCCRATRHRHRHNSNPGPGAAATAADGGVILPRIIFVAEDDDDDGAGPGAGGLDQAAINSYPKFPYSKSNGSGDATCSICLCEYKDSEMLRMMPDCRHCFHLLCLDAWLKLNGSCPVCRNSPLPTPLSTPLSELVPLSQYPGDRRR